MLRFLTLAILTFAIIAPANARVPGREAIGVFAGWAAFRDEASGRCFAIAEPARRVRGGARGFATITRWPARNLRGQVYFRLTRPRAPGAPLTLSIADRRIMLVGGGVHAWAPDARGDRAIVATMRWGSSMSIEGIGLDGRPFADTYRLAGAPSAIDAAAVACLGE